VTRAPGKIGRAADLCARLFGGLGPGDHGPARLFASAF
jgi:hypothetical protein